MMQKPRLIQRLALPFHRFIELEASGGLVLMFNAVLAMGIANSPWRGGFASFWHTEAGLHLAQWQLTMSLGHWVNDGLMALFFYLVGLEIKREMVIGELKTRSAAALPVMAALGGMIVPALIYFGLNFGRDTARGWGIGMATDIAFALGVLMLFGKRVPTSLKLLLMALAIADDMGAVLVIALFYSSGVVWGWLMLGLAVWALMLLLGKMRVSSLVLYGVLGVLLWYFVYLSGVHATIAGVLAALAIPLASGAGDEPGPLQRMEDALHPWVAFGVMPVFALANAGVSLSLASVSACLASPVGLGVLLGLVVGKQVGIVGFVWASLRLGWCSLPAGLTMRHISAMAWLGGIGFTMSLFINNLAFSVPSHLEEAKIGIVLASLVAGVGGAVAFWRLGKD